MPDLITLAYAQNALAAANVQTVPALGAILPALITAASQECQRFCNDRDFVRGTYTEEYQPALDGRVRLKQMPVNQILKVEGRQDSALTIFANPALTPIAWVVPSFTGDYATGQTFTGLVLDWYQGGAQQTAPFTFVSYPTIDALAAAITGLGGVWTANTGGSFASGWPATVLTGLETAQGALDTNGVQLAAYTQVLAGCACDQDTGMLWTGQATAAGAFGPRWGPDWAQVEDAPTFQRTRVRVTYDAGFQVVPALVQAACYETLLDLIKLLDLDQRVSDEADGEYSYTAKLADALAAYDLPTSAAGKLSRYVMHHA